MRMKLTQRGVSLVELLIAIGVISVGLLGVAASLTFGTKQSGHGEKMTVATNQSRVLLETMVGRSLVSAPPLQANNLPAPSSGINDSAADRRALTAPPFNDPTIHPDILPGTLEQYTRRIRLTRRGQKNSPGEYLLNAEVTIFWTENGVERNTTTTAVIPTSAGLP